MTHTRGQVHSPVATGGARFYMAVATVAPTDTLHDRTTTPAGRAKTNGLHYVSGVLGAAGRRAEWRAVSLSQPTGLETKLGALTAPV